MVKVAFIGDIHLADKNNTDDFSYEKRNHYVDQHEYVRKQIEIINQGKPDHVILLGDLVDWFTLENIDFALDILAKLEAPWDLTPGNHDLQLPVSSWPKHNNGKVHESADETDIVCRKKALAGWTQKNIPIKSRKIDFGDTSVFLLDSGLCSTSLEDQRWFVKELDASRNNIVATHVPFAFAETHKRLGKYNKNREGYFQDNLTDEFNEAILSKVGHVFFGHVHFTEHYDEQGVAMHMIQNSNVPTPKTGCSGIYYLDV